MASGSAKVMYGMINPGQVSNRPTERSMLKIGVTSEICGNIAINRAAPMSAFFPGKSSRATA
ncbi:Uncharacterised protein [Mycobacteroides abscessus subsp. abscessus]|nr:Uncharacterised protein [Mycobacteroides abscessus subsp. abscessus]